MWEIFSKLSARDSQLLVLASLENLLATAETKVVKSKWFVVCFDFAEINLLEVAFPCAFVS